MASPYDIICAVPSFTVTSTDVADGEQLPLAQVSTDAGGGNLSPQLSWSGFPSETRSFAVTVFDPDAPTASGFWHWAVHGLRPEVTSLPTGAGAEGGEKLPSGARMQPNEYRHQAYEGAAPPPGHGRHRYFIAVHALDLDAVDIPADATPAVLCFSIHTHTLARAVIAPWYEVRG